MKTAFLALIASTGSVVAAEAPHAFPFHSTTEGAPLLKIRSSLEFNRGKDSPSPQRAKAKVRTVYIPREPTDLVAPSSTRDKVIVDFQTRQRAKADHRMRAVPAWKRAQYFPWSSTDLIIRRSDSEALLQVIRSRVESTSDQQVRE